MRALLVALAIHAADAGTSGAPEPLARPARYAAGRRAFAAAVSSGNLDRARVALEERRAAAPGRVDLAYDLACIEARAGGIEPAFAALAPLAAAGLAVDFDADADLAPLHGDPRWDALRSRLAEGARPVQAGKVERSVPAEVALAEDLAVDPGSGAVFVSSVRTGTVWRWLGGRWSVWARPGASGEAALALGIDARRRRLHVGVAAMAQAAGFRKEQEGRSALVTLRLDDGAEVARYDAPGERPHLLGDLTVGADGTVYVSDAMGGTVSRLQPGGTGLEPLVRPRTFSSPQTPALASDGRTLYVPDYTLGLFALPVTGGEPEPVLGPADLVTGGIDGLTVAPGGLVAVQNGIVRSRVVRLWLSPDGRRIVRWSVLARGPELGDPTHVIPAPGGVLALFDSGWNRFSDDGALQPGAPPSRARIVRLDVH